MKLINSKYLIYLLAFLFVRATAQDTGTPDPKEHVLFSYGSDTLKPAPVVNLPENENDQWWTIFGYESLNELVNQALENNHRIAVGESQVKESEARVDLAKSALFPSLAVNPSFNRVQLAANQPMLFQKVTYNTWALPVELSYEVDLFGKNNSEKKASRYWYESSAAGQKATKLDVTAAVVRNYVLLLMLDSEAEVFRHTRLARQENLEIVTTRYEAGLTNDIDVQRAKTELSSVDVEIRNIQIERRQAELQLAELTGQQGDRFNLKSKGIRFLAPEMKLLQPQSLISERPDLQASRLEVEAWQEQLKSARRNLYPSVSLVGSAGLIAADSDHLFEKNSRNWLLGTNISIPLFEGRRRQSLLDISEFQLQGSAEQLKQKQVLAVREVSQAMSEIQRLNEQLTYQKQFLEAAFRTADLSRQRYRKGLVTYLEVVDADRIVLEAERLLVNLISRQLLSTVDLIRAAGGNLSGVYD